MHRLDQSQPRESFGPTEPRPSSWWRQLEDGELVVAEICTSSSARVRRLDRIAARRAVTPGHITGAPYQPRLCKLSDHKVYGVFG